jgi:hypothetical protein
VSDYYVSLAFGPTGDRAAIAILAEAIWIPSDAQEVLERPFARMPEPPLPLVTGWVDPGSLAVSQREYWRRQNDAGIRPTKPALLVQHVEAAPVRASLRETAARVVTLIQRAPLAQSRVTIVADCTASGPMTAEMMAEHGLWVVSVLRGGELVHGHADVSVSVPDLDVEQAVRQALAEERLKIAADLPGAESLAGRLRGLGGGDGADEARAVAAGVWYRDWFAAPVDASLAGKQRAKLGGW